MIRYLKQAEKVKSRELYSMCFLEDSESFKNYYYDIKTENNLILVSEDAIGQIRSMAHLNPYRTKIKNKEYTTNYIVAVATDENYRRQGLMRKLIKKMLNDMREERKPFTWLMPAKEEYYKPFGFEFICDKKSKKLNFEKLNQEKIITIPYNKEISHDVITYINNTFYDQYEVFCIRDDIYMEDLCEQIFSENGSIDVLYKGTDICGVVANIGNENRTLICEDTLVEECETKPLYMARIVDLNEFVKNICLKKDNSSEKETFIIKCIDKEIEENDGVFFWHIDKNTSYLEKITKETFTIGKIKKILKKDIPTFNIGELTQWLFGYSDIEDLPWKGKIRTLNGVFFDEIV